MKTINILCLQASQVGNVQGAKAKQYLKILMNRDTVYFLYFLADLLTCMSSLSMIFQKQDATIADIGNEIELATHAVTKLNVRLVIKVSIVLCTLYMYNKKKRKK